MEKFSAKIGKIPFMIQRGAADVRNNLAGSRDWRWAKDATVSPSAEELTPKHTVCIVDTDYYLDMPHKLVDYGAEHCPVVIYAFQPEAVARSDGEYSFTFNYANEVTYEVAAPETFKHMVWNYGVNMVGCFSWSNCVPIYQTFEITRIPAGRDHALILLVPQWRWRGIWAYLARQFLSAPHLERLRPVQGDYLVMESQTLTGRFVHIGQVGRYLNVTLAVDAYDALRHVRATTTTGLHSHQVESMTQNLTKLQSALLVRFLRETQHDPPAIAHPPTIHVRPYQFNPPEADAEAKPAMMSLHPPLWPAGFVPTNTLANVKMAIEQRLINPQKNMTMSKTNTQYLLEFAAFVVPVAHMAHPASVDEVYEKQCKPSQRARFWRAMYQEPTELSDAFIKKEAYQKCSWPRVIVQFPGQHQTPWSTFTLTMALFLTQTTGWYAFGHTPKHIAMRVAEICTLAKIHALCSDFANYDGSINEGTRDVEIVLFLRLFHPQYHQVILELLRGSHHRTVYAPFGMKFKTAFQRHSGESGTAVSNSAINAFHSYASFRKAGHTAADAYARLGIYGGDDGLVMDIPAKQAELVAQELGLTLTVDLIPHGQFGVEFLSRKYSPYVWWGDPDSCCDVLRTISKINLYKPVEPKFKYDRIVEKAYAIYLSDANTPIVGDFVKTVLNAADGNGWRFDGLKLLGFKNSAEIWNAELPEEAHYPNENPDWMWDYVYRFVTPFNHELYQGWLHQVAKLEQLYTMPAFTDPPPYVHKADVLVDGEVRYVTLRIEGAPPATPIPTREDGRLQLSEEPRKLDDREELIFNQPRRRARRKRGQPPRTETSVCAQGQLTTEWHSGRPPCMMSRQIAPFTWSSENRDVLGPRTSVGGVKTEAGVLIGTSSRV